MMAVGRRDAVLIARFCDAFLRKGILKGLGVLVPAMTVYLGTNYATIGLILSLNAALMQLACTLMNPLMKRLSIRWTAATGGLVSALCIISAAFTRSVYLTGFLFLAAGLFSAACNLGTATTLHKHFGNRFGCMNSLCLMGLSAGSTLLPLLTAELHQHYGLSGTILILGALLLNEFPIGVVLVPPRTMPCLKRHALIEEGTPTSSLQVVIEARGSTENVNAMTVREIHNEQIRRRNGAATSLDLYRGHEHNLNKTDTDRRHCGGCSKVFKDTFDFRVFREEKYLTFFMVPILILTALTNYSWVLFVTSYAISVGIDSFKSAYLAAVGAAGGMASCALQAVIFNRRPLWSPHVMALLFLSGAVMMVLQTLSSSLSYLLICSFIIGASLYGASTVVDAVVAVIVAPRNFQGAIAFTLALEGVGTLIAGPFSGFLFDYTGSFETVFRVLGGMAGLAHLLSVALVLSRRYHKQRYIEVDTVQDLEMTSSNS